MFVKPSKKWRNPEGDSSIMVPYTYYRLCESYRDVDGKVKQRTVLGLGELLDFPTDSDRKELADLLTEMINDGTFHLCDKPKMYDAAVGFYGKWLEEKKEAQERADKLAEEARRKAEEAKERSMYELFIGRYETGLEKIKAGIDGKGTKKRDKVNARLGRLDAKFPGVRKNYDISFTYNENDVVTSMIWSKNAEVDEMTRSMHGKYLLQTSLDEKDEENIWEFYNVIRTVEETFKTLKSDLDIRPVFHKTDNATKAHLNLAVLAYWVVSTTKYRLKQKGINARWEELLRIMSTQQRVTMVAEQAGHLMKVRRSTTPETKLTEIQTALGITALPVCSIKSVWLREQAPEKDPPSKSGG